MFIGKSKYSLVVQKQIFALAKSQNDVFIHGESGVGKRIVAKAIHARKVSKRRNAQLLFFSVNCSVLDGSEVNAILFGSKQKKHQRSSKKQEIAPALKQGGTILIEQIGSMNAATQLELTTFLERQVEARKKGERRDLTTPQLILTSKHSLDDLREEHKLLETLAKHLDHFEHIAIPPLRERPEDMPVLANHFIREICRDLGRKEPTLDQNGIDLLLSNPWKGNVRELERVIERAVLYSPDKQLLFPPDLADEKTIVATTINAVEAGQPIVLKDMMDIVEKRIIERTLEKLNYGQTRVATFLGMKEQTLRYKLKRLGIPAVRQRWKEARFTAD